MSSTFDNLHIVSSGNILSVADVPSLPATGVQGDIRYVLSVSELYTFDGAAWSPAAATSFTGPLVGDVTGTQGATVVSTVAGSTAANVHAAELLANAGTSANTASTLVKRDGSGNFSAGLITASLSGNVAGNVSGSAATFTSSLIGDVSGTRIATVVDSVGGSTSALVHAAELLANAATDVNTASTIVKRDSSGNFTAGTITAALTGHASLDVPLTSVGASSGVASLDSGGKVPIAQLPSSVMEFQGVWDASTNTPTLADGVGNTGDVYRVSVAGTQNLGSGAQTFVVGDWAVYNGTIWQLAHAGADQVNSVNGAAGVVTVNAINQLTSDVTTSTASGSQSLAATVASVGGSTAALVHAAELLANAATNANTVSTIVKRDGSGNFSAGTITAALTGNASTVTTNANLTGPVTSVGNATAIADGAIAYSKVALTGAILNADLAGSIADTKLSTIATAGKVSNSATTATNANTASAIVARDGSGNFTAGTITANLTGTASNVTTNANLTGPVTSTGNATAIADGALALAKLATTTAGFIPVGAVTTGVPTYVAMSGDVTIGSTGVTAIGSGKVTSAMIVDGTIVDADINASAAIAGSKVAVAVPGTSAGVIASSGTPGNVTGSAVAATYVGEIVGTVHAGTGGNAYATYSTTALGTGNSNIMQISLTTGVWLVSGAISCTALGAGQTAITAFWAIGNTQVSQTFQSTYGTANYACLTLPPIPVVITGASASVSIWAGSGGSTSTGNGHQMSAVRVA